MVQKVSCQWSADRLVQGFPLSVSPEFRIPLIEFIWNLPCAEKNQNVWHPPEDSFCLVVPDNCNNCLAACFGYSRNIMSYWRGYLKIYFIIGFFAILLGFLVASNGTYINLKSNNVSHSKSKCTSNCHWEPKFHTV